MNFIKHHVVTNYDKSFPVYVTTIGCSSVQEFIYRLSGMSSCQLLYTACGRGKTYIHGKRYDLEPNTIFFLPAGNTHFYEKQTDDWKTYWITYGGSIEFFEPKPAIWTIPDGFNFLHYYNKIMECRFSAERSLKSSIALYELLVTCKEFASAEQTAMHNIHTRLDPVFDYLYGHFTENTDIACLAGIAGVSHEYFCRIFKECTNMRPLEYITRLRIEKAKTELMQSPDEPINKIARDVGYSDISYFIKKFREAENLSPASYRKKLLQNNKKHLTT